MEKGSLPIDEEGGWIRRADPQDASGEKAKRLFRQTKLTFYKTSRGDTRYRFSITCMINVMFSSALCPG
jgi:hypothetical protein